jgi:hypothetical protein
VMASLVEFESKVPEGILRNELKERTPSISSTLGGRRRSGERETSDGASAPLKTRSKG